MVQPNRPPGCPLFLHRNGNWAKKVRGRLRYFGKDLDEALRKWVEEKDHLLAGMTPPRVDSSPSLAELANLYLDHSRRMVAEGEVRGDHTARTQESLTRMVNSLGKQARLHLLTPEHWQRFRSDLSKPQGRGERRCDKRAASTIGADLRRVRAFLNWCRKQKLLSGEISHGGALDMPSKREERRNKAIKGSQAWEAAELRQAIEQASVFLKPVVLLAINGGMGIADIGRLTKSDWRAVKGEILHCPRHKTGVDRKVWLWPETIQAVDAFRKSRPAEHRQKYESCLLLTKNGYPWWRLEDGTARDLTSMAMATIRKKTGSERTLYDCRRTFRTVASEVCDLEAIDYCMGHESK